MVEPMTTWSIREVPVCDTVDAPEAWLLHGYTAAMNEVLLTSWGNRDFERTAQEVLGSLHDQRYDRKPRWVAVRDDDADAPDPERVLAYAAVNMPLQDNTHTAHTDLGVRPAHRSQGIGTALFDAVEATVRADGRRGRTRSPRRRVPAGSRRRPRGPGSRSRAASPWSRSPGTRGSTCRSTRRSSPRTARRPRRRPGRTTAP